MAAASQTATLFPLPAAGERAEAHQVRPRRRPAKALRSVAGETGRPAEGGALVTTTISEPLSERTPPGSGTGKGPNGGPGKPRKTSGPKRGNRSTDACAAKEWHIHVTRYDPKTGRVTESRVPYVCRSWRHEGDCRRWAAAQAFVRVRQALLPLKPKTVVYMVFTLDPKRHEKGWDDWDTRYKAFRLLMHKWKNVRRDITRNFGANRYISTVEVHRSGWPHLNVVMECEPLAAEFPKANSGWAFEWLKRCAARHGFGWRCSIERARDKSALAGYVVKLAGDVEQAAQHDATGRLVGEVVKLSQVPEDAPSHFRRIRASIRFLPKPYRLQFKDPNVTGELVKEPVPEKPKKKPKQPALRAADIWGAKSKGPKRAIDLQHPSEIWDN